MVGEAEHVEAEREMACALRAHFTTMSARAPLKSDDSTGGCPSAPITALLFKSLNVSYPWLELEVVKTAVAAGD